MLLYCDGRAMLLTDSTQVSDSTDRNQLFVTSENKAHEKKVNQVKMAVYSILLQPKFPQQLLAAILFAVHTKRTETGFRTDSRPVQYSSTAQCIACSCRTK
jgi:hypothetical protein